MERVVLIVAGGKGKRMKSKTPKQFLMLNDLPVLMHTLNQFSDFEKIFLVLPKSQLNYWKKLCEKYNFQQKHILIEGGKTRFQSVKNGLKKIPKKTIVAIHDGVRPIISKNLIAKLFEKTKCGVGAIPAVPIKDSMRKSTKKGSDYIDRKNIYAIQTPQCFLTSEIQSAYKQNYSSFFTDDASVFESKGGYIHLIKGEEKNIKITTSTDLKITEFFMQEL